MCLFMNETPNQWTSQTRNVGSAYFNSLGFTCIPKFSHLFLFLLSHPVSVLCFGRKERRIGSALPCGRTLRLNCSESFFNSLVSSALAIVAVFLCVFALFETNNLTCSSTVGRIAFLWTWDLTLMLQQSLGGGVGQFQSCPHWGQSFSPEHYKAF